MFILMQLAGGAVAYGLIRALYPHGTPNTQPPLQTEVTTP
jgi:hypothetical protein